MRRCWPTRGGGGCRAKNKRNKKTTAELLRSTIRQGCTNPRQQVTLSTKFFRTAPNVCWFSECSLLQVTHRVPRILRWFLDTWKICAPLSLVCIKIPTKTLIYEHEIRPYGKVLPYV